MIYHFENFMNFIKEHKFRKFNLRKDISDKRKKIPQTKIYLHWYAGRATKNNICINFSKRN